ncbi:MAG TPA: hypothetical protein VGQ96_03370, partial [Candidatus Eremiobacteraceae bacterium]|nr:hypothetical protein [Candidatus Eremiobacteraceae bacterium]
SLVRFRQRLVCALLLEAIAAVDGLVAARLERHLGRTSAAAARRAEHLTLSPAETAAATTATIAAAGGPAGLASCPAVRTTVWLVLETFLCVEFLLTGSKRKLRAAIDA